MGDCKLELIKLLNLAKVCGVTLKSTRLASLASFEIDSNKAGSQLLINHGHRPSHTSVAVEIFYQGSKQTSVLEETNFIRWLGFLDSELKHHNTGSRPYLRALQSLETLFEDKKFLNGSCSRPEDVYLATYLEERRYSNPKYPNIHSWSERTLQDYTVPKFDDRKPAKKVLPKQPKCQVEPGKKLRILCVHGYRQTDQTFKVKLGSFRKVTGKLADYTFITAPNKVDENEYGWWLSSDSLQDAHLQASPSEDEFKKSLSLIGETFRTEGPFHGVLCFSQGAALGASLCALQEAGYLQYSFKFCILVAGFVSRNFWHEEIFKSLKKSEMVVSIPTLHVFGSTDQVIEIERSVDLLQYFQNAETIQHDGGHFVPTSGESKQSWLTFLEKMRNLCFPVSS